MLVVGYGKIGRVKSFIWSSLGRDVCVYDTSIHKNEQAELDGFRLFKPDVPFDEDLIIDISTPASCHLGSLRWTFDNIKRHPRTILIEKPLVSSREELKALVKLLSKTDEQLRRRIAVNESYYLSLALDRIIKNIEYESSKITKVRMELSKNRLEDVWNGRFVDEHLGPMGIELPHMIAMAQRLGFDPRRFLVRDVSIFQDGNMVHNEGFRLELSHELTSIAMESYLGAFRILDLVKGYLIT